MSETPDALGLEEDLVRRIGEPRQPTFGAEEEVMLLDPDSLDLLPAAESVLAGARERGQHAFALELPASQIEIITSPCDRLDALVTAMAAGRADLLDLAGDRARMISAGAHPFAAEEGVLHEDGRYGQIAREYGAAIRRQLVCGLHVHVGLGGPGRVLAVYNALRGHLPDIAALAANAPVRAGRSAEMASVRPAICTLLPRQGVPPAFASLGEFAAALVWGERSGRLQDGAGWWWELRIHPRLGTLELRVPDAQSRIADAGAVVAFAASLVLWLAARHDAGELLAVHPSWRIAENRWSAARHGPAGQMIDLDTGEREPTRERLERLCADLEPVAAAAGGAAGLERARELIHAGGAERQLASLRRGGPRRVAEQLVEDFAASP